MRIHCRHRLRRDGQHEVVAEEQQQHPQYHLIKGKGTTDIEKSVSQAMQSVAAAIKEQNDME